MSFISRWFSSSSSQNSSQSSYRAQTVQVAPKKLPFSFLELRDPSLDWREWSVNLNRHITTLNQTKRNSKAFNTLLITIGNILNTHMRQTRTCRGPFARDVRATIQGLTTALETRLTMAEKKALAERKVLTKNPKKTPLIIKLIILAEDVIPLTHQTCAWDKMPLVIKITILAQGLHHGTIEGREITLQIIRNEITVNRALGNNLLVQYIRESNCLNLERLDLNSRELAILVTGMDQTGLRNRISFIGLEESSMTWRFYREYMKSQPKVDWGLIMSAMNSDGRQPSLALLSKEERDYLIHNLSSIRHLGHSVKYSTRSYGDETPHILSFLREAIAHDSKQGFALWARTMAAPYVHWDLSVYWNNSLSLKRTQLTQAEIEGIVENMDSIPLVNWPGFKSNQMTWQEIFRVAFNKGLNGHLESWHQLARLINYQISENCPEQQDLYLYWNPLDWRENLIPWSVTGLPLEDLPSEFRALITRLHLLHFHNDNLALDRIVRAFPNLTALCIAATNSTQFILPENCRNLEVLILENVNAILGDMPSLRMLRLGRCDSIVFSASYYGRLEFFEAQHVNYRTGGYPLFMPVVKTIELNNCKTSELWSELPYAPCVTKLTLDRVSIRDIGAEKTNLQEISVKNCPDLSSLPYTPYLTKLELNAVYIGDIGAEKTNLQELSLTNCFIISSLPHSLEQLTRLNIEESVTIGGKIIIRPLTLAPELLIQLLPGKNCLLPFNILKKNPVLWLKIFHAWVVKTKPLEKVKEGLKQLNLLSKGDDLFDLLNIHSKSSLEIVDIIKRLDEVRFIFHGLHYYYKWPEIYFIEQSFEICLRKIRQVIDSRFNKHFFDAIIRGELNSLL